MGMFYGHNQSPVVNTSLQLEILTTSSNQSVTIPHLNGYTYNYTIDYGDGNIKTVTSYNDINCTNVYTTPGTYTITISGICETFYVNNTGTLRLTVKKVLNWGNVNLKIINFYGCSNLTDIVTDNIGGLSKLVNFNNTFNGCSSLTSIPTDLFRYHTQVSTNGFTNTFYGCSSLTSIPSGLFRYNTLVSTFGFYSTFYGCSSLTSIPTDLFRYNTLVSTFGFAYTFYGCSSLTSIPSGLFDYCTQVSSNGFDSTFYGCSSLTSIPTDLFRYNTLVSTSGFGRTFASCISLTSIPTDLFRYNTLVSSNGFYGTFQGCTSLETVPNYLFRYNTKVYDGGFDWTFANCTKLQLNPWIFYADGEQSTRFSGITNIHFGYCFIRSTFTGTQGTSPDLWNCTFGGTVTRTQCFYGSGNNSTSISNYSSIPLIWIN